MANVLNLVPHLPRNMLRGPGKGAWKTSITLHYNGPPVALADREDANTGHWIDHWEGIARYHLKKNWGSASRPVYGNGVMYHYAFLPDGTRLNLFPEEYARWHCANEDGNATSLAIAFAVGGAQDVTDAQWEAAMAFCLDRMAHYRMQGGRNAVRGHREWPRYNETGKRVANSPCPGPVLMRRLTLWRDFITAPTLLRYTVVPAVGVNVREGPGTSFPIALAGKARLSAGYTLDADKIVTGERVESLDSDQWAHLANGLGFVALPLLKQV